jgi:predicted transcriptional regulator
MTNATTTIRVSIETHRQLTELAQQLALPLQEATARAVSLLADQVFWQQTNDAYAALRANAAESMAFDAELAEWDSTLLDGLAGQA